MIFNSLSESVCYFGGQIKSTLSHIGNFMCDRWPDHINWQRLEAVAIKATEIAKKLFVLIASVALLIANPVFFTLAFAVGFVCDDSIQAVLEHTYKRIGIQPVYVLLAIGCGALISLPVSVVLVSSIWALHLGSKLSSAARQQLEEKHMNAQLEEVSVDV